MLFLQVFGDIPSDPKLLSDALRLFDNFHPLEKLALSIVKIKPTLLKRQFVDAIYYAIYVSSFNMKDVHAFPNLV